MTVITGTGAGNPANQTQSGFGMKELDKNAFLQLLVTQLRWQDPLNPKDSSDFVGQMAQLSALEQSQNLNAGMDRLLKMQNVFQLSLLGREVVVDDGEGTLLRGPVDAVEFQNGVAKLVIGKWSFGFDQLVWVESGSDTGKTKDPVINETVVCACGQGNVPGSEETAESGSGDMIMGGGDSDDNQD